MIPLVELPKIVEHYTAYYTEVFFAGSINRISAVCERPPCQ